MAEHIKKDDGTMGKASVLLQSQEDLMLPGEYSVRLTGAEAETLEGDGRDATHL